MDNKGIELINLAIAFYQDKVERESLEKFHTAFNELLEADAASRRALAQETVLQMANFKRELLQFKIIYNRIKESCGVFDAVEQYIKKIEYEIEKLSKAKNNHYFK